LVAAAAAGPVLPLFVVEPELWQEPDMSGRQWQFVAESLTGLRDDLGQLGQPLIVRVGDALDILERARRRFGLAAIWSHEETGNGWTYARDRRVAAWARQVGLPWHQLRQSGTIRGLKTRNGWAQRWDRFMSEPVTPPPVALPGLTGIDPGPIPEGPALGLRPDPCPGRQSGGRFAGLERLSTFLTERGAPYRKAMSSPAGGARHGSRLSPHLAWGTLSIREVAQASWQTQAEHKAQDIRGGWRGSLSSFQSRLHWRDHFIQKLEDTPSIETRNLHSAYDGLRPSEPDTARLHAWCAGETGLPFIDACMRALNATGWMNFRMRAMLMSFASYHLWLDWRSTGAALARRFTDYEAGIHWPQTQMQSGTTGINTIRIYNPIKQGLDQDPTGTFIRRWVPELAACPDTCLHRPWTWDKAGGVLGKTYPLPIVEPMQAAADARQKVWAVRSGNGFAARARQIQDRHGSRKSGIKSGRRRRTASPSAQLDLPLGGPEPGAP